MKYYWPIFSYDILEFENINNCIHYKNISTSNMFQSKFN